MERSETWAAGGCSRAIRGDRELCSLVENFLPAGRYINYEDKTMSDWTAATACLVLGLAVTTYYYRIIRRGNFKMSPIAIKGEDEAWHHTPNRLRFPMWVAGGFFAASCLELISLSLGFKLSDIKLLHSLLFPIIPSLLLYLLFEKNPLHLRDSQRKYPSLISILVLGAALALRVCSHL